MLSKTIERPLNYFNKLSFFRRSFNYLATGTTTLSFIAANTAAIKPTFSAFSTMTNPSYSSSIKVVPSNKLHVSEPHPSMFGNGANLPNDPTWTNKNWLKSRFHFSFAEYYTSKNADFGVLRVMNDDLVQPHRGFGSHPHGNMEIITYIVHGELTHQDSMGTKETLGRGSIQFMTAGTGVVHSEFNKGDKPLRFIQTWIQPAHSGLKPNYGSFRGSCDDMRKNKLHHLVSNVNNKSSHAPVAINQDVDGYACELEMGTTVNYKLDKGRQAYLLCIEGGLSVNGQKMAKYDGCEIHAGEDGLELAVQATVTEATEHGDLAHFLMFSMKDVPGAGRRDI